MGNLNNNERKKLFSLFENIDKQEIDNKPQKNINSDVLIIDGTNTFMRSFSVNPALNDDGEHVGGIDGFLKSIGYAIRILNPTRCIIVFDGKGGSKKRKSIFSNYKAKRKVKTRINRVYEDISTPEQENKSLLQQIQKIAVLCQNLPVTTMAIDNIEADDTIAFLCTETFNNDDTESIVIMSSDKDFYQLVNDKVKIYSPTKKRIYGPLEIFNEFGITSRNYIYFKILNGDKSDNIDGVNGIGEKTAIKLFPQITKEEDFSLNEMINYAADNANGKSKKYNSVVENKQLLERNFGLMQLGVSDISNFSKMKIQDVIAKDIHPTNVYEFTALLKKYKMFSVINNHHVWLRETFETLDFFAKNT